MRHFYVDYENVQSVGLDGLDELTDQDKVIILYSTHADSMKIDIVKQLQNTKARVSFVEADTGTTNALDFQLITLLFIELNAEDEFLIVSKDTGFDAAIKMAKRQEYSNVRRVRNIRDEAETDVPLSDKMPAEEILFMVQDQEVMSGSMFGEVADQISSPVPYAQIETIITDKCGAKTCKKYGELIITGLRTSGNKNQFYQFFRKNLGDVEGGNLYRSIRTKFDDMRALL